jgi:hypothetical protein
VGSHPGRPPSAFRDNTLPLKALLFLAISDVSASYFAAATRPWRCCKLLGDVLKATGNEARRPQGEAEPSSLPDFVFLCASFHSFTAISGSFTNSVIHPHS